MKIQLHDGSIKEIDKSSSEAFEVLNHSTSHLLAEAIKELYPDALFGFGPAIEEGFYYDIDFKEPIVEADLVKIEKKMHELANKDEKITRKELTKEEALKVFKDNKYKIELIEGISENITTFTQGSFTDLCRGPHIMSTGLIKHFKLLNLAGAYWRGNSNNKMLVRIYGTSFFSQQELDAHLKMIEERKKRDHRILGKQLNLFMLSEYGPGFAFWLPNGMTLLNELENFWKKVHIKAGYVFVKTPIILSKDLWLTSGHWDHYKENMYTTKIDERDFAIKPMNCPGGILVYKSTPHSYKELPLRMAELGLVHRHEASGALNGLFRVRSFVQDDAHIFCREDQLVSEIQNLLKLYEEVYGVFGLDYYIVLSTRPEKDYIGDIAIWDKAESILKLACEKSGRKLEINPGDGAFYGPKLDFKLKDSIGRIWQCGTIQLDMNLPERFDCTYIDNNGNKVRPIMLHRTVYGSMERFTGILIEHYAGAFPTWLAPIQVIVLPVNNDYHLNYVDQLVKELSLNDIRVIKDDSNEKLGYRLRNAQIRKIPFTVVVGDKEVENDTITYRLYSTKDEITISKKDFIALIKEKIATKSN